jgi:hypothetical protein
MIAADAWTLYRNRFGRLAVVAAIAWLPAQLVLLALRLLLGSGGTVALAVYAVAAVVLAMAALVLGQAAMLLVAGRDPMPGAGEAYSGAVAVFGRMLALLVLVTLILLAADAVLLLLVLAIVGIAGLAGLGHVQAVALGVFVAGAAVLPFLLFPRFALAPVALVLEGLGPVAAIRRGLELSRGRYLRLLGLLFVLAVIGWVLNVALGLAAVAIGHGNAGLTAALQAVVAIVLAVVYGPATPAALTAAFRRFQGEPLPAAATYRTTPELG